MNIGSLVRTKRFRASETLVIETEDENLPRIKRLCPKSYVLRLESCAVEVPKNDDDGIVAMCESDSHRDTTVYQYRGDSNSHCPLCHAAFIPTESVSDSGESETDDDEEEKGDGEGPSSATHALMKCDADGFLSNDYESDDEALFVSDLVDIENEYGTETAMELLEKKIEMCPSTERFRKAFKDRNALEPLQEEDETMDNNETRQECSITDILAWLLPRIQASQCTQASIINLLRTFPYLEQEWDITASRASRLIRVQDCTYISRTGKPCQYIVSRDKTPGPVCRMCPFHATVPWIGPNSPFCEIMVDGVPDLGAMKEAVSSWLQASTELSTVAKTFLGPVRRTLYILLNVLQLREDGTGLGCPLGHRCPLDALREPTTTEVTSDGIFVVRAKGASVHRVHVLCRGRNPSSMILWRSLREHAEKYHRNSERKTPVWLKHDGRSRGIRIFGKQYRMCFTLEQNLGFPGYDPSRPFVSRRLPAPSHQSRGVEKASSFVPNAADSDTTRSLSPGQEYRKVRLWQGPVHGKATPWLTPRSRKQAVVPQNKIVPILAAVEEEETMA